MRRPLIDPQLLAIQSTLGPMANNLSNVLHSHREALPISRSKSTIDGSVSGAVSMGGSSQQKPHNPNSHKVTYEKTLVEAQVATDQLLEKGLTAQRLLRQQSNVEQQAVCFQPFGREPLARQRKQHTYFKNPPMLLRHAVDSDCCSLTISLAITKLTQLRQEFRQGLDLMKRALSRMQPERMIELLWSSITKRISELIKTLRTFPEKNIKLKVLGKVVQSLCDRTQREARDVCSWVLHIYRRRPHHTVEQLKRQLHKQEVRLQTERKRLKSIVPELALFLARIAASNR